MKIAIGLGTLLGACAIGGAYEESGRRSDRARFPQIGTSFAIIAPPYILVGEGLAGLPYPRVGGALSQDMAGAVLANSAVPACRRGGP